MRCAILILAACMLHAGDPRPPAKAVSPRPSDAQMEAAIRAKLAKSKINADHFTVHVQGGVATLEGHTDVIQHKGVATRLAKSGGATAVNNRIQISDAARQKAAGNLEQGRRRAQIKRSEPRTEAPPRSAVPTRR
jgi:osmotically-inducible protein OsmY